MDDYGLPQFLNWRRFVAPSVIENADKAFVIGWKLRGPDQEYADHLVMEYIAEEINHDLSKLSSGWMIHAESARVPITLEAGESHCPELTSQLVFEERAAEYAEEGKHFETRHGLFLTWLPPSDVAQKFSQFFFPKDHKKQSREVLLSIFQTQAQRIAAALGSFLILKPLSDDELKCFLWYCVTGKEEPVNSEEDDSRLNYALGATEMKPWSRKIGGQHVRVVGVHRLPQGSSPQMLADLLQVPFEYRFSQRYVPVGTDKIVKELKSTRNKWGYRNWYNPAGIRAHATQNMTGQDPNAEGVVDWDDDADDQMESIRRAIKELRGGYTRGGYYTQVVILRDEDEQEVEKQAEQLVLLLNRKGFSAVIETANHPYAFKGSLPGHGTNIRRPRLTARHFARLWNLHSPWRGPEKHPSPLYPPNSPPLLICKSSGNTPFHFSPELHFFVIGPTGNGKTTLLNSMAMGQLQYDRGQVFEFDLGASALVPTLACGGEYIDLHGQRLSPLAHIDQPEELSWALDFLEHCVKLRDFSMTPQARVDLQRALTDLSRTPISHRTITTLLSQLQTHESGLANALSYYSGNQSGAMLDGQYSPLNESHWLSFDIEALRKYSAAVRGPALMAQIHALQRRMDGRPTLMLFEEGWIAGEEEILKLLIEEESATARKKVVSIGLVLHSPGDLNIFPHADRLRTNVTGKVFLPNPEADTEGMSKHYSDMGLGRREIRMIADPTQMRPRSDYYVVEGNQRRKFQLPWGNWQAALLGVNGKSEKERIFALRKQLGSQWFPAWLRFRGHHELAHQWEQRMRTKEAA